MTGSEQCLFGQFLRHFIEFKCKKSLLYTQVGNVCPGWPIYDVKCLCSRGMEMREGGEPLPLAI